MLLFIDESYQKHIKVNLITDTDRVAVLSETQTVLQFYHVHVTTWLRV